MSVSLREALKQIQRLIDEKARLIAERDAAYKAGMEDAARIAEGHGQTVSNEPVGQACSRNIARAIRVRAASEAMNDDFRDLWWEASNERDALRTALEMILPLAEAYLKGAPTHPDNAKLETARATLRHSSGTMPL